MSKRDTLPCPNSSNHSGRLHCQQTTLPLFSGTYYPVLLAAYAPTTRGFLTSVSASTESWRSAAETGVYPFLVQENLCRTPDPCPVGNGDLSQTLRR